MSPKQFLGAALAALACSTCLAQFGAPQDPDWREADAPPPPALKRTGLIPLEVRSSELRFGIDPDSISIGSDRIVRYVVVAQSANAVNGIYEGINCSSGQVRVYARYNPDKGWVRLADSQWVPIHGGLHATYSLLIARQGACLGQGPNQSASSIVRDLRSPSDRRFRPEYR